MNPRRNRLHYVRCQGFTLMEMILALAVSSIVLAGIGGVFFSAIRLRERTVALVDETVPLQQALTYLRRDLRGALPREGTMAGYFKCGALTSGQGQSLGLQFSTTTGVIRDDSPWADVQEVTYELREPTMRTPGMGKDLIRSVSRNLLSTTTLDYNDQILLGNVESLEVSCFDGLDWRDLWDTSLTETNIPAAVRVRIQMVADANLDIRNRQPYEMIIPLVTQPRTNQVEQTTGGIQ
jgi:type II secretion system protein J